jgi:UDP-N-acetylmuramate: L-alanyl-gamma-D-glutamyl-meso-diaminopimelate ligase
MIPDPPLKGNIPEAEKFSSQRLVKDLEKRGLHAFYSTDTDLLLEALEKETQTGDVILFMSNGAFDNLPRRLLERL